MPSQPMGKSRTPRSLQSSARDPQRSEAGILEVRPKKELPTQKDSEVLGEPQ